jgi:phage tail-like protein
MAFEASFEFSADMNTGASFALFPDTKTGASLDLFATFKFHVEIGSITEAAFTECQGLDMKHEPFEYQEGGQNSFVYKFPNRTKYSNITLKRGFILSNEIFEWYKEMETALRQGTPFSQGCFRSVSIRLYSSQKQGSTMQWNLDRAFPVKWAGPTFNSGEAAVAVETLEFAHHGISLV